MATQPDGSEDDRCTVDVTNVLSDKEEREAFYRHTFMGETMADIGDILDVSASTISRVVSAFRSYPGSREDLEISILEAFTDAEDPRDDADGEFLVAAIELLSPSSDGSESSGVDLDLDLDDEDDGVVAAGCLGCGFGYDPDEYDDCPVCSDAEV